MVTSEACGEQTAEDMLVRNVIECLKSLMDLQGKQLFKDFRL